MAYPEAAVLDPENPASPLSVTAAQTALLLMDYHNVLISRGGERAAATVVKGKSMREWATSNGALVVHCLVDMKQSSLPSFKAAARFKLMSAWMDFQPESAEEHPDIAFNAAAEEKMVTRCPGYMSALKSPGLGTLLSTHGIKSLILCGVSTSGCVLSTARAAGDDEYIVTIIEDACMDPVPGLHDALVQNVLPSQAHVTTAAEFQKRWNATRDFVGES